MPVRLKKLIGTAALVALVIVYAILAVTIAEARLSESSTLVRMSYFLFTGLLWIIPAMFIISWMAKPPKK